MAIVKNPFLSTDARGSIFGLTASMTRGGNVVKKKARPSTKYEKYQTKTRSILGWLSRQWGELTTDQRNSWDAWAIDHPGTDKFGDPFIMSGFNAFIMLNHNAVRHGDGTDMNVLPPEDPPPASLLSLYATTGELNPGDVDLDWGVVGTGIATDHCEVQVAGPFQSMGRKSVKARFVFRLAVAGNLEAVTITSLDEGMWYWFRVRYVAEDGQITAWHVAQATPKLTV